VTPFDFGQRAFLGLRQPAHERARGAEKDQIRFFFERDGLWSVLIETFLLDHLPEQSPGD
jgi:hypothetical protein